MGSLGVKRKKILEGQRDRQGPGGRLARGGADGDWLRGGVGWVMGKPQCCSSFFYRDFLGGGMGTDCLADDMDLGVEATGRDR